MQGKFQVALAGEARRVIQLEPGTQVRLVAELQQEAEAEAQPVAVVA